MKINDDHANIISNVTNGFREELKRASAATVVSIEELGRRIGLGNGNYLNVGNTSTTDGVLELDKGIHPAARNEVSNSKTLPGSSRASGGEVPDVTRFRISNVFTGSGADYEKPCLQKVGTGSAAES